MEIIKNGKNPSRRNVSWFGTVKTREAICEFRFRLYEEREIVPQGAPHALLEPPGERRNRSMRLVERDSLDALHREKQSGKPDALSLRVHHLPDEIVKRIQIDAAQRDSGCVHGNKGAP